MARRHLALGFTFWVFTGIAVVACVVYFSFWMGSSGRGKQAIAQGDPEANCAGLWTMCRDNADLVNYSSKAIDARHACIAAVNAAGKYGHPKWCSGWLCEDFASYQMGANAPDDGLLTLIDDHVQMQNSLSAWVPSTVYCTYNIRTAKVVTLNIRAN
jgi:hypothetical protein